MTAANVRDALIDFVEKDLVGPAHGETEEIEDSPRMRYSAGVLFPQEATYNESSEVSGVEEGQDLAELQADDDPPEGADSTVEANVGNSKSKTVAETEHDQAVVLANSYRPSAMAMSFMVDTRCGDLVVEPRAAVYEALRRTEISSKTGKEFKKTTWKRRSLDLSRIEVSHSSNTDLELHKGLKLRVVSRAREQDRALVTICIYNTTREHSRLAQAFYQVGFSVSTEGEPAFLEYRSAEHLPLDREARALAMLYRKRRVFGIGHGCAVEWPATEEDRVAKLTAQVLPSVVVPPIEPLDGADSAFDMQTLAGMSETPVDGIPAVLEQLCGRYAQWIDERKVEARSIDDNLSDIAEEHLKLCATALSRMREGIAVLSRSQKAMQAFTLANQAMLMQQHHARRRRSLGDEWTELPTMDQYTSDWSKRRGYWRAFQIAYFLMTIPGIVTADDTIELEGEALRSRDLVDLIWFPTGGGKTEAYLAVSAFVIFLGRLRDKNASGCKVLMRYTLRLLTSQQFQRAASLICACEVIRRSSPDELGKLPVSIGLWVGESLTPNKEKDAIRRIAPLERRKAGAKNPFQLLSCPWCGTELNNADELGYDEYREQQIFVCPTRGHNAPCPFSKPGRHLPVCIVDESIYRDPPTLIIGTVDKFAMMAWRAQAGRILQIGGGPDLVIQDELHLISGPLGSMVGLYEGVIDYLCSMNGKRPKIIASTATIRRANAQCKALYNRPMFQFPPPGLDASNSFFARENRQSAGRTYVGFLPTATSSPLTAQIRSVVALQQGARTVGSSLSAPPSTVDPYWTLVQYFGSLKELGRAATFITADIPEFLPTMHRRYSLSGDERRYMRHAEELTSRKNEEEIPAILKRLEKRLEDSDGTWASAPLDTVLATNMISVGMDVPRLGLMMVVTQPKGTAEYIQASSRVGRSTPGLVFTLYNASRPRDRSHYEQFYGYHSAFYQFVEPTSVTPFAPPALERALHAVLVIAGRHIANWKKPTDFDRGDTAFSDFCEFLTDRARSIDEDHLREFNEFLRDRLDEWEETTPETWGSLRPGNDDSTVLMRVAGAAAAAGVSDSWPTPTSLRNVDVECSAEVVARYTRTEVAR